MTNPNPLPPEIVAKWNQDWNEFEPSITYRNDPDYGMIEFFIDEKLITTWSYADDPHDALEEFRNVVKTGFLMARQSQPPIKLPSVWVYANSDGDSFKYLKPEAVIESIEAQGYPVSRE